MKIYFGQRKDYFKDGKWWEELKEDIEPTAQVYSYEEGQIWLSHKLEDIGFKSYYKNINYKNDKFIEIDFGDYSYFCLFYDLDDNDWLDFYGIGKKPNTHSSWANYVD